MDIKKLLEIVTVEEYLRYHILHWEYVTRVLYPRAVELFNQTNRVLVSVIDLEGLNHSHFHPAAAEFLQTLSHIDQDYYPENGILYIINAPWIFRLAWKIIKPWVKVQTRSRIHMISGDPVPTLKQELGEDVLPEFLGGRCRWMESREEREWMEVASLD